MSNGIQTNWVGFTNQFFVSMIEVNLENDETGGTELVNSVKSYIHDVLKSDAQHSDSNYQSVVVMKAVSRLGYAGWYRLSAAWVSPISANNFSANSPAYSSFVAALATNPGKASIRSPKSSVYRVQARHDDKAGATTPGCHIVALTWLVTSKKEPDPHFDVNRQTKLSNLAEAPLAGLLAGMSRWAVPDPLNIDNPKYPASGDEFQVLVCFDNADSARIAFTGFKQPELDLSELDSYEDIPGKRDDQEFSMIMRFA
jgi:hypothetical protein